MSRTPTARAATSARRSRTRRSDLNSARDQLASAQIVAEYTSLRDESRQAQTSAQGAVSWSLSIYGVIFGAGLLAFSQNTSVSAGHILYVISLFVFAVAAPGVACVGAWTWLGELGRMERAGAQLRGIEASVAAIPRISSLSLSYPITQETYIATHQGRKERFGKQRTSYIATSGVFFAMTAISHIVFWIVRGYAPETLAATTMVGSMVAAVVIVVVFLSVSLAIGLRFYTLHDSTPAIRDVEFHNLPGKGKRRLRLGRRLVEKTRERFRSVIGSRLSQSP